MTLNLSLSVKDVEIFCSFYMLFIVFILMLQNIIE
jgi:hypothetical protein